MKMETIKVGKKTVYLRPWTWGGRLEYSVYRFRQPFVQLLPRTIETVLQHVQLLRFQSPQVTPELIPDRPAVRAGCRQNSSSERAPTNRVSC